MQDPVLYRGLGDHTFYNMYYIYTFINALTVYFAISSVNLPTFHTIHFTLHYTHVY